MSEEGREGSAREAEGRVKVVDRRRFDASGRPLAGAEGEAREEAREASSEEARTQAELIERQAARIEELSRAYAALLEDNRAFRQRLERDKERVLASERADVAQTLLEAADDLERALAAVSGEPPGDVRSLAEGVRLSLGVIHQRIARIGAERIPVVGLPFDPHVAEAMDTVAVADEAQDGVVLRELRAGYRIGDRLLRPARVSVGRIARA